MPIPRSSRFFPMLFSRNFIILCLTFRSVVHFVNFCEWCKVCVSIHFFLCMYISSSRTICWKDLYCLRCIAFAALSKINWVNLCRSISRLSILFIGLFVYSFANTILFLDYCCFIVLSLEVVYFLIDFFFWPNYMFTYFLLLCVVHLLQATLSFSLLSICVF